MLAVAAFTAFGGLHVISLFPQALHSEPVAWWPLISGWSVLPLFVCGVGVLVSNWLLPKLLNPLPAAFILVTGLLLTVAVGLFHDIRAGVAVYPDRFVFRNPGYFSEVETLRFDDITRVETACVLERRRRSRKTTPIPIYEVRSDNQAVDLSGPGWIGFGGTTWHDWLPIILAVDQRAETVGAVRGPRRKPNGEIIGHTGCVSRFVERFDADKRQAARDLFRVHMSELRPEEYVLTPVGS